jgi:hypothetical protein|tara:strand:+ start:2754 stop:2972 length:219 start_codon:yes stop_codon:yes gene_type:complete
MPSRTHHQTSGAIFMTGAIISFIFSIIIMVEFMDSSGEKRDKYGKDLIISSVSFVACWIVATLEGRRSSPNV